MAARAISSATVSFGLVSIPVKVYSTSESGSQVRFNMLDAKSGSRVKQQYISADSGEIVPRSDMARGYEFAKGQYVMLSEDEYKALQAVGTGGIELTEFVPAESIDPVYFDKAYYLGPDKGGERAYGLLGVAMRESGLVGIAKYAARGKQYMVALRPLVDDERGLVMQQLRYPDEIKSFSEVPLGDIPEATDSELKLAKQIIEQISTETFEPEQYTDEVKERMLELIQQKIDEGEEIAAAPEAAPAGQVIDLMEALKASLGKQDDKASGGKKNAGGTKGTKAKPAKAKTTRKKSPGSSGTKKRKAK